MSVSSISSQSALMAEWRTYLQQASRQQQTVSSSRSDGDSATISQQGFAALLGGAAGGAGGPPPGGPPELTDSQVAAISSNVQSQNADLFSALDSDSSGSLSSSELKAAQDLFRPDRTSSSSVSSSGGPPALTDEQVSAISSKIQSSNAKLFSALDTNQDGTLSAEELKAGHDQLMPQGGPGGAGGAQGAGGPPPPPPPPDGQNSSSLESQLTDDQAASIGSNIQSKNATLFATLDTDANGTLSASELKTGVEDLASSLVSSLTGSSSSSTSDSYRSDTSTAQDHQDSDSQRTAWQSSLQANVVQSIFTELFAASSTRH